MPVHRQAATQVCRESVAIAVGLSGSSIGSNFRHGFPGDFTHNPHEYKATTNAHHKYTTNTIPAVLPLPLFSCKTMKHSLILRENKNVAEQLKEQGDIRTL